MLVKFSSQEAESHHNLTVVQYIVVTWRLGTVSASSAPVSWPGTQMCTRRLLSVTGLMQAREQN